MTFVSQLQLVLQVAKTIVDRSCTEHQHFGLYAGTNHPVHQSLIAVFFLLLTIFDDVQFVIVFIYISAITEVVAFVYDNKVVIAPVYPLKVNTVRHPSVPAQIAMKENVITQTVGHQRIILVIGLEGAPVVVKLLRTEHKYRLVAVLVVLDHTQSRKGLAQAHRVGKDAPVILFEFVDDSQGCILLEVVELVPYNTFTEPCLLVRQHIFVDILKEFVEDVVQCYEVYELRRILLIHRFDVFQHLIGHILKLLSILPLFIEYSKVFFCKGRRHHIDHGIDTVATLTTQFCSCKLIERHISM